MRRRSTRCGAGSSRSTRTSSSTSRKAASRTTRSCSRRNRVRPVAGPVRILLVEDNDVFREALVLLFGLRDDVEIVAAVGEGEAAVQASREYQPDVVLMDYRLPGMDGVQATRAVLEANPGVAVVGLTGED